MNPRKVTKTNFKNFIRKNEGKLFIRRLQIRRSHAGMDYLSNALDRGFEPAVKEENGNYKGLQLVAGRNNYFNDYEDDDYQGIKVYNLEATVIVAAKKRGETK